MLFKKFAVLTVASFVLLQGIAKAEDKVAVVDIQKVVSSSLQVQTLKKSQEAKQKDIEKFIKNAKADINKQKDEAAKKKLSEKYENELIAKKKNMAKDYSTKLQQIDKDITAQIGKKATEMGYTVVIPKSAVLWGGYDITEDVIKVIK